MQTEKEKINSSISLVDTLIGTLLMCSSKTQRKVILVSTETGYIALLVFAQEEKFVNLLF